ncbi:ABC transporter permease [Glutamicibacter sp. JC586]|uniref:ABC transporter permease n=1 Tax=Glutamicibacter sp. JC586 TaxID=2590552 RepID=UPI00135C4036|nr:ABC transporter permease [Glutamicibacter sp. JC586]
MIAIVRTFWGRILQIVLVALFVTIGTTVLIRLVPGDPARSILGARASDESVKALNSELGLDLPLFEQLTNAVLNLFRGDLGTSFAFRGQDVISLILPSLSVTAALAAIALTLSAVSGIAVGLALALTKRPELDLAGRLVMTVLLATPGFMAGLVLLYIFAINLGIAPAGGWAGEWPDNAKYLWLPALALTAYLGSLVARAVRQAALETIGESFVQAARTRGVPRRRIVMRHVLPNAILPVIPLLGLNAGALVSGAVIVEAVFTLPGLGSRLVEAMASRDLPVVQGIALLAAVSIVVFNLLADLSNMAADPRLRKTH